MQTPDPGPYDLSNLGQTPPPPRSGWPPAAQWAVGCGSGCALLVLLQGLMLAGLLGVFFNSPSTSGVIVKAQAPKQVVVGQKFPVTLVVKNTTAKSIIVTNINARQTTLSQFTLTNPQPPPSQSVSVLGTEAWSFNQSVGAGATWKVTFDTTAKETGTLDGSLEAQIGLLPSMARFQVEAKKPAGKK